MTVHSAFSILCWALGKIARGFFWNDCFSRLQNWCDNTNIRHENGPEEKKRENDTLKIK